MSNTITVDTSPSLGPLFVRAAVTGRGRKGTSVPDRTVAQHGVLADPARLADYQRLCGFDVSDVLPAPFVHVLAFPLSVTLMSAPDFPLPLVGLVHVANTMTQVRPVRLGEQLDLAVHAADLRPHDAGRQVDLVASATVDGEPVWSGRSTYLQRTGSSGPKRSNERPAPPAAGALWRLPADLGRRYAAVSGDTNPIHLSALSAKALGFPKAIAHGMWMAARAQSSLGGLVPDAATLDVAFKTPAFLPSTVGLHSQPASDGWDLALFNVRSGKPHLTMTVRPAMS